MARLRLSLRATSAPLPRSAARGTDPALETRAAIRAAPELGVEDTATRLFRAEDPSPRTSLAAMATYLLGFFYATGLPSLAAREA